MTREEIMLIAKEAGVRLASYSDTVDQRNVYPHELERFAKLIKEREREACVQIIEEYRIFVGNSVAGELAREWTYNALKEIRDDIRART